MKTAIIFVGVWILLLEVWVRLAQYTSNKKERERWEAEVKYRQELKRQMEELRNRNQWYR